MTDQRVPVLIDKHVVLGVTGSIAAYKAIELASRLVQAGARVDVVMTAAAQQFVTPLSFQSLTHRPVVTDMFSLQNEMSVEHVGLARRADVLLVAPATADVIARLALGLADDPLTTTALATSAPLVVAPAMERHMLEHPATAGHLTTLRARGAAVVESAFGYLASGATGRGRLADSAEILGVVRQMLGRAGDLAGRHVVVTAGGTREPIDPVRVITNRSSGKMGYALAEMARDRGARVSLVSTAEQPPVGVKVVRVETVAEMAEAVRAATADADALIMAAAPADFRPALPAEQKIKKSGSSLTIDLVPTVDILAQTRGSFVRVGFAAESERVVEHARAKLLGKDLDLIVANDITLAGSGFGADENRVVILDRQGGVEDLPLMAKTAVAQRILDRVVALLKGRQLGQRE
ncbi:MAG: bifunctional phosphopantothenoylcysteine decarboxylase/phosphopantothenate--cysteine ligase CoaBC [Chloroflexi bacterium]|nr:bifunctional phosphopantothenoylcysteine decarboxylase/phosphopantothenate--cysteine ligase CoaBC [Chloroflexota bacterium]